MWEWFTINGIWILIVSAVVLILMLLVRHQVQQNIAKAAPQKWHKTLDKSMRLTVWVIEGICLVIFILALAAIIVSREGVHAIVTTETIQRWFLEHGIPILIIVLFSYLLYRLSKLAIPGIVERLIRVGSKGRRAKTELAKRSQTLGGILINSIGVIIVIVALFMALSEVGVNIAPLLAGAGVVGIAIGFGAQSLIKDLIAGFFIIAEDQYNVGDVIRVAGIAGGV